jgi:hypothetical protein
MHTIHSSLWISLELVPLDDIFLKRNRDTNFDDSILFRDISCQKY